MNDIFISYASQERDRVLPLVKALEKTGWSVFWDRSIPAGRTWRRIIGSEIQVCRSVVVVWTENSITSEWVQEEAEAGKRKRILIPVLLDNVEPPFGFRTIQAANLAAWNGDDSSAIFTRLVADIAAILGPAPRGAKKAEEGHRLEAETQSRAEEEGLQEQERQRSEQEGRRKAEEETIEQEANRAGESEKSISSDVEQARKESPKAPQHALERQGSLVTERFTRPDRRQLYAGGAVVIVIGLAVIAFWFFALPGSKDADMKKIVSVGIQGKRQLIIGEKIVLRVGGRLSDGSEADVTKNLDWRSSDESVVAVSVDGKAEARKEGFADITVRYEGITSPPWTLVVRGESRSAEAEAARVATEVQEHIKTAGSYRDRGDYSSALAELAKAGALDPVNKIVQAELERTRETKQRREAEARRREDKRRADEEKRRQAGLERKSPEEAKPRSEEPQKQITTPVFIPPSF
jgi:TIR domain